MSNATESSKKAFKRGKLDKLSIEAALRNIPNSAIRLVQRDDQVVQRDEELNKIDRKGKKILKGEGKSKKVSFFGDEDSSEENFSEEEFPKNSSSEDDSDDSSVDGDFPLSKMFKETKFRKEKEKTKTNKRKKISKEKFTKLFSSGESSEEESPNEDKAADINKTKTNKRKKISKEKFTKLFSSGESSEEESPNEDKAADINVRDLSNEVFSGREANDINEPVDSNLPSTEESHKSKKSKRSSRPSAWAKVGASRMKVLFNERGQPIGEASVRFSSVLGGIAAEMVPLTSCDWRLIPGRLKSVYWLTVQQKFIIDEAHKTYTLQQIGKLWRAHKSRLRKKIRACKSKKELKKAKPENIGVNEWIRFAKEVFKRSFMKKSKKFKELRATQDLPHTCSRKGYARLEDEMKKESPNPESITRIDVWSKGHTKKDGTASNKTVSEAMEKIREFRESVASSSGIGDDALTKLLGPERGGRVRGLGSGVTPSKVGMVSQNKAHVIQLQEEVGSLKEELTRQNELIKKLLVAVQVQQSGSGGSFVGLNTSIPDVSTLGENMMHPGHDIDVSKVQRVETEHILEPRVKTTSKSSSPPQARGSTNMLGRKCKLMNWKAEEELVAVGRWDTNEPSTMVHNIRLGDDASRVWVDHVINGLAPLWRTNPDMVKIADAKGSTIAWPNKYIIFDDEN